MQIHVSAAKAGVDAITRNLSAEWGRHGIRVNGIAPGPIEDTEGMKRLLMPELKEKLTRKIPLRTLWPDRGYRERGFVSGVGRGQLYQRRDARRRRRQLAAGNKPRLIGGASVVSPIQLPGSRRSTVSHISSLLCPLIQNGTKHHHFCQNPDLGTVKGVGQISCLCKIGPGKRSDRCIGHSEFTGQPLGSSSRQTCRPEPRRRRSISSLTSMNSATFTNAEIVSLARRIVLSSSGNALSGFASA